jgi:hypothetical protein
MKNVIVPVHIRARKVGIVYIRALHCFIPAKYSVPIEEESVLFFNAATS